MTPSLAYGAGMFAGGGHNRNDYEDENCRHCGASSLWTDWSSGDVVCRECGVVAEQHVRFQGAEWREFAADVADGLGPSGGVARCDLNTYKSNHNDNNAHNFGMPTTTLLGGDGLARKRLLRAHHKTQHMLERQYKEQLKQEKMTLDIQERRQRELSNVDDPPYPVKKIKKIEEEENCIPSTAIANKELKLKLASEKWSLSRALQLHENVDNNEVMNDMYFMGKKVKRETTDDNDDTTSNSSEISTMVQKKCAKELYTAYSQMKRAVEILNLPIKPIQEQAVQQLCTYVALKDGWNVPKLTHDRTLQISSIVTTFLYLACKQHGYTRTLKETCQTTTTILDESNNRNNNSDYKNNNMLVVKTKYCSKVMKDIQQIMPESIQNATRNPTQNNYKNNDYVKHFCLPLKLPSNAIQAIQICLTNYKNLQIKFGIANGIKQSNICAAMVFFVGWVGYTYSNYLLRTNYYTSKKRSITSATNMSKKHDYNDSNEDSNKSHKCKKIKTENDQVSNELINHDQDGLLHDMISHATEILPSSTTLLHQKQTVDLPHNCKKSWQTTNTNIQIPLKTSTTFDIMSHEAISQSMGSSSNTIRNNHTDINNLPRNLWKKEKSWYRDMNQIEHNCHVSRNIITDLLRQHILPHKDVLLEALEKSWDCKGDDHLLINTSKTIGSMITWNSMREKVKN